MFHFANPRLLLLALAVPPLVWWWLRQRRGALRAAALVLLVGALAGPRWPDLRTRIATEGIAVVMLVDVSGSMAERDFDWAGEPITRLDAVKKVFRLFVAGGAAGPGGPPFEGRPTDLIGLVTFATRPETACPLT